jgi:V/A-type H+-transporting ATPase subunit I
MTRILVVGSKDSLQGTIDTLYGLESVHLVDFSADEPGFSLGSPLPAASDASQKLLKLRSMERDLEIKEVKGKEIEVVPVEKIVSDVDGLITGLDAQIFGVIETKANAQARMHDIESRKKQLEPFMSIPLPLELYSNYQSLSVISGFIKSDPTEAIQKALGQYEIQKSDDGKLIVLFVQKSEAQEAQRILVQSGFTEVPVPQGTGLPAEQIKKLDEEYEVESKTLEEANKKIDDLREKHESFILASDEQLSIDVEKAETPLRLGTTKHAFAMDGWVSSSDVEKIQKAFSERLGDKVFVEVLEVAQRSEHHEPEHVEGAGHKEPKAAVPTKQQNGKTAGHFEFLTELISTPRYNEIDPTTIIAITFPFFFGLMVGDLGYGIPFTILGALGLKKCTSKEWRTIATMLFYGGIWTMIFGFFLFGEAFGLHFAPHWDLTSLGSGASGAAIEAFKTLHPLGNEMTWSSLLGTALPSHLFGVIPIGIYSKLDDVKILLFIAVWIGVVHLYLGFGLGFANKVMRHGWKHAIMEKGSWLLVLTGMSFLLLYIVKLLLAPWLLSDTVGTMCMILGVVFLVPGILMAIKAEGATSILELPGLMSNIISYARLAAIGMSKAGLALAFNTIAFVTILGFDKEAATFSNLSIVMFIVALLILIVGHLAVFILGILSAGMHGIRLHYVELFQKFYEGGGVKFNPLKVVRKRTSER